MTTTVMKAPRAHDPILFRAGQHNAEFVVRPCSKHCRELWMSGYIVLSCRRCDWHRTELTAEQQVKVDAFGIFESEAGA